ncbi:MAG TPA: hypothetical protein VNP92_09400 [Actinophytocola sp.]|nr:hypothetical protein [Actinophytocola sp.]
MDSRTCSRLRCSPSAARWVTTAPRASSAFSSAAIGATASMAAAALSSTSAMAVRWPGV